MIVLLNALPVLSVAALALVVVVPWALPEVGRAAVLGLIFIPIHYWSARRPALMPPLAIFVIGLFVDLATGAPLGYTSLLGLAVSAVARSIGTAQDGVGALGRWAVFFGTMIGVAALSWAVGSVLSGQPVDWPTRLLTGVSIGLAYPLLALGLMPIDRMWDSPRQRPLVRGG